MERTSDVIATWAWGLRRYAWIVVLLVVGLGVVVPLAQSQSGDVYHAQAQVGPTGKLLLPNLDPLPRFAQSVFDDGAVAHDVRRLLRLAPGASVIPGRVRLRTAQDNPVLVVSGSGSSPGEASSVANTAADTLVVELNRYSRSVGIFAVQSVAVPPTQPDPPLISDPWGVVIGVLAGLVAGCGLVGLIIALRRPVVGTAAAQNVSGLPVLGKVPILRKGAPDGTERMAVGAMARRLLRNEHDIVYVTGPVQSQVERVTAGVSTFLAEARRQRPQQSSADGDGDAARRRGLQALEVTALSPSSLETWVEPPDHCSLTLLVVPEGIRTRHLHQLVDQRASGGSAAIALVTPRRSWVPLGKARKAAVIPATDAG